MPLNVFNTVVLILGLKVGNSLKASNAPVDPPQVEKVTVTVKLHADHSAADGNRAVTSEVNRPAISPIVTVTAARRQRTPSWKSWVTQDSKTGKKLFLAKGLMASNMFYAEHSIHIIFMNKRMKMNATQVFWGVMASIKNNVC